MKFYDTLIRLQASMLNEVWKRGITAAEVHAIHAIHGAGSIAKLEERGDMQPVKMDERKTRSERARIDTIYGASDYGKKRIDELFGTHKSAALPETASMEDFTIVPDEDPDFTEFADLAAESIAASAQPDGKATKTASVLDK